MTDRQSHRGIPSATNVHHIGLTVPNLDEAVAFFVDVLGCIYLFRTGPFEDQDSNFMLEKLAVHPRASLHVAMLRCGPVTNLELLEWNVPEQVIDNPRNSDIGAAHLAFQVTDIALAVDYLRGQRGVRILDEPTTVESGQPSGGSVFVYFVAPWGLQLELIEVPRNMPYEATTSKRMFGPAEEAWQ
jgi:catechol 2,3-dioxygenase-like lactoylglutathione lyase family enzyme